MRYFLLLRGAFTPPGDPQFRCEDSVRAKGFEQTSGDRCYHLGARGARDSQGEKVLLLQFRKVGGREQANAYHCRWQNICYMVR